MITSGYHEVRTGQITAVAIVAGIALGLVHILGPYLTAGIILFLFASVIITFFKSIYHRLVLVGILLLSFVFIEPSPSDLILSVVIPLGLLTGVFKPQIKGKSLYSILILFLYFIASLPGIAFSLNPSAALRFYLITFYLFLIALFVCTYACRDNITSLLRAYLLAAFFSFLAGLAGYLGFFPDLLMPDAFRVRGLFKDPNVFGPFFVPAIIILIDDIYRKNVLKTHSIIHVAVITMLTIGVIFSFSRAAFINLFVSIFLYFVLNIRTIHFAQIMRLIIAVLLILAIVVGLFLSPLMSETGFTDFLQERAKLQNYDNERFNAHFGGIKLITQNPFGYGPGQFDNEIVQITDNKIAAHSLYIRVAVENGVIGFILFFVCLAYMLIMLLYNHYELRKVQNMNQNGSHVKDKILYPSVVIAIICGLLVNSLVVDTLHWRHFWFFIGLGLYCLKEAQEVKTYD